MHFRVEAHQLYIPIDTAEECKVGTPGIDGQVQAVICADQDLVFSIPEMGRQIEGKSGETASVLSHSLAVANHRRHLADRTETNIYLRSVRLHRKGFAVPADTLVVISTAVLPIESVPRVGK